MVSRRERVVTTSCVRLLPQVVSSPPWIPSDQQKWGFGVIGYQSPEEFVFSVLCFGPMPSIRGVWEARTSHRTSWDSL